MPVLIRLKCTGAAESFCIRVLADNRCIIEGRRINSPFLFFPNANYIILRDRELLTVSLSINLKRLIFRNCVGGRFRSFRPPRTGPRRSVNLFSRSPRFIVVGIWICGTPLSISASGFQFLCCRLYHASKVFRMALMVTLTINLP